MEPSSARALEQEPEDGAIVGGKYRLIRRLDEGGMGTVWVAENVDLAAPVAVKLLRAGHRGDAAERLAREARVLARLNHPAIVRVFDSGKTDMGVPFLVTELLHGETLADALWQVKRLSPLRAVQLVLPLIEALAVAHDAGIVHRDLKPGNIFLARLASGRRQPKILDFGIAALIDGPDTRTTGEGVLLGSPSYMAPEQARALVTVDGRADLWAIAVILYEMLVGHPPFEGPNHHAVLAAVVRDEPESTLEHRVGDAALWSILARGLAKDPARRWPSALDLGRALAAWLLERGVQEDAASSSLHATWVAPPSASLSSYPPVMLAPRREAITLPDIAREPPQATHPPQPLLVEVGRPRSQRPSVMWAWVVAGMLVGASVAWVAASLRSNRAPAGGVASSDPSSPIITVQSSAPSATPSPRATER